MRRVVGAAAAVAAMGAWWWPGGSAAEDVVTKVGWWTASPLAEAPEGGGAVQRMADGSDATVSAVRVQVPSGEVEHATLVLIEDGGFRPEAAALQVCVSPADFEPVAKGPRDQAPAPDCAGGSATLARASTGTHWSADVSLLLAGRPQATLVVLSAGAGTAPPLGYEVRFRRPTVEVAIVAPTTTSTTAYEPPPFDPSTPPPIDVGGIALPVAPPAPPSATVASVPSPPPEDTGRIQPLVTVPHDGELRPWGRLLGFAPLSAAVGIVAGLGRRTLREVVQRRLA